MVERASRRSTAIGALVALVAGISIGLPLPAVAATATSSVGWVTSGSYPYQNYAQINNSAKDASTWGGPRNFTAPAGWVGSRGRLFSDSTGALLCEGSNNYNTVSLVGGGYWGGWSCQRTTSGAYYSYGVSRFWNGSSYGNYYTFTSPSLNW